MGGAFFGIDLIHDDSNRQAVGGSTARRCNWRFDNRGLTPHGYWLSPRSWLKMQGR